MTTDDYPTEWQYRELYTDPQIIKESVAELKAVVAELEAKLARAEVALARVRAIPELTGVSGGLHRTQGWNACRATVLAVLLDHLNQISALAPGDM